MRIRQNLRIRQGHKMKKINVLKNNLQPYKKFLFLIIFLIIGVNQALTLPINKKIILSNLLNTITNYCMVILGIYIKLIK